MRGTFQDSQPLTVLRSRRNYLVVKQLKQFSRQIRINNARSNDFGVWCLPGNAGSKHEKKSALKRNV